MPITNGIKKLSKISILKYILFPLERLNSYKNNNVPKNIQKIRNIKEIGTNISPSGFSQIPSDRFNTKIKGIGNMNENKTP